MKNILVYGLAGWEPEKEARVVLNAIRNLGYRSIFLCDKPNEVMKLADYAEVNPLWSYDLLKKIATQQKIDLAILIVDFASSLVGRLNRELDLPGPTDHQYALVSDKLQWSKIAIQNGLSMPKELLITKIDDFENWDSTNTIIVKPTKSTGNVSNEYFGYKYYDSLQDFKKELVLKNDLDRFFHINTHGTIFGKYIVQERLDYKLWGNLGLTIVGKELTVNEMHDRFFHAFPYQTHQYASLGPITLTGSQNRHAEKVCDILVNKVGFKNTGLNIDIIETIDKKLFTVDINVRFGSTWSTFLPLRKINYFEQAINGFLGLSCDLPKTKGFYLRHKIDFQPGVIESVTWPKNLNPFVQLQGMEFCLPGTVVAQTTGRHTWPLEALITADSEAHCWQLYNEVKDNIKVSYQKIKN